HAPAKPARAVAAPAKPARPAAPGPGTAAAKSVAPGKAGAAPGKPGAMPPAGAAAGGKTVPSPRPAGARPAGSGGKKQRKSSLTQRIPGFQAGDLLVPGGAQGPDEVQYFLRGVVAAEHAAIDAGVGELITKKATPEGEAERER